MAETDILNPVQGFDKRIQDSMNPNQGWSRTRPSTLAVAKPAFGAPMYRQTGNSGHIYTLNYSLRNLAVTERLKQFYERFEDEYFTLIDWDNGRHYVGHFVGDIPQSFVRNGRYTSQGWQFEEVPGAPMLKYPDQWERWAIERRPFYANGAIRVAINSANWVQPAAVADDLGVMRQPNQLANLNPTGGDTCTFEYRGYGFRLWAAQNPASGLCNIAVDGVAMGALTLTSDVDNGIAVVYQNTAMPLDVHRVTLTMTATKALTSSQPNGLLLDRFEVMR